ncbi:cytochrome P450 [Denitrobaculum tricleocarpae]|uniref:Cytochrome P450 n=1 Tax=Denitrobaculum tricleocarpae TaxID=2591009 RepID=A0A545TMI1_9PROT|nr:cytochrome P450 [Denitrobaculum tricleocarpae]
MCRELKKYYGLYRNINVDNCCNVVGMNTETNSQTMTLSPLCERDSQSRSCGGVSLSQPLDPISAVTAPDPYPLYAALVAERPLYFDDRLGMWVACGAEVIERILSCRAFRVRPLNEAVPKPLLGTRAGDIFGQLVRMRDGGSQVALKQAVCSAFAPVDTKALVRRSDAWMQHLLQAHPPADRTVGSGGTPPDIACALPVYAVGSLLGTPSDLLPSSVFWMEDFVRAIAPGSTSEQIARGSAAAENLVAMFQGLLQQAQFPDHRNPRGMPVNLGLLSSFARSACRHAGHEEVTIIANAIGFLSQSYEATAGLIGNTLIALQKRPKLQRKIEDEPAMLGSVIREVARHDSPVQNTRRFLVEDKVIAGQKMRVGDAVLLVLAAGNRDPAANSDPEHFDPDRCNPSLFTFSAGAHLCPGAKMALALAQGGVQHVLASEIDLERLVAGFGYRASQNGRIPMLNWETTRS